MISRSSLALSVALMLATVWVGEVGCHGNMVLPHSWFDFKQYYPDGKGEYSFDYIGMKSGYQCFAGCMIPAERICNDEYPCKDVNGHPGCSCMWYTNYTMVKKPTLYDPKLRTYGVDDPRSYFFHPWRAPGAAPIPSPCGVAGGNLKGCIGGDCNLHKGGFGYGPKAKDVDFGYDFYVTNWTRGEAVEVVWGITANHGGGYSYRMCKLPEEGPDALTEECFQQTPLKFVGDTQWVQYGEDKETRIEIPATRTSQGTTPKGSQWTKNPIPACIGGLGGFYYPDAKCPNGTQFPPPKPELYGFGVNTAHNYMPFQFSIIDKVMVPKDLAPGQYVLSFRWDTEQTPQVWNTCASIALF